jgi:hypothetical protein
VTTDQQPRPLSRVDAEKRRHRLENLGVLLLAVGVVVLIVFAVAVGSH